MTNERKPPKATEPRRQSRPRRLPESAADWFKRGSRHAARKEMEDALAAFRSAVQHDPGNLLYRRTLRATEYRKYHHNRTGGYHPHGSALRLRAQLAEAKRKRNWTVMDNTAEDGLALNPWDVELNIELGHACHARGFQDVATFAWQCALESDPSREDVRQLLAENA